MKNIIIQQSNFTKILLLASLALSSCLSNKVQCVHSKLNNSDDHALIYKSSLRSGDISAALNSLNYLVVLSQDSVRYFDTIAHIYKKTGAYNQCIYWSKKSLMHNDSNCPALALLAESYLRTNQVSKAITAYEQLIRKKDQQEYHLYLSEAQYRAKHFSACIQTTRNAEKPDADNSFRYYYRDTAGIDRFTNINSALLNYRGLAYYETGDLKMAIESFKNALYYDPEFQLAMINLMTIQK